MRLSLKLSKLQTGTSSIDTLALSWKAMLGNTQGYIVERADTEQGTWNTITHSTRTNLGLTSRISCTTPYWYRIQDIDSGSYSQALQAVCPYTLLVEPAAFSTTAAVNTVDVSWQDNNTVEDRYVLERSLDGSTFVPLATLPADSVAYKDADVTCDTAYTYRLSAYVNQDLVTSSEQSATPDCPNNSNDSDNDGLPNDWETQYQLDPTDPNDANSDVDTDNLTALQEFKAGTDPLKADTDGDTLNDDVEINSVGSNPTLSDTDSDGLSDADEHNTYKTDPSLRDSDADQLTDAEEINTYHTDPLIADTDSDTLSDYDETLGSYAKTNPNSADTDNDGLNDKDEYDTHNTDPTKADTDADGLSDFDEINVHQTDPLTADMDADGLMDGEEINQ